MGADKLESDMGGKLRPAKPQKGLQKFTLFQSILM